MAPFMGVFFVAFFVAILATPLVRKMAIKNGIIDPDLVGDLGKGTVSQIELHDIAGKLVVISILDIVLVAVPVLKSHFGFEAGIALG